MSQEKRRDPTLFVCKFEPFQAEESRSMNCERYHCTMDSLTYNFLEFRKAESPVSVARQVGDPAHKGAISQFVMFAPIG